METIHLITKKGITYDDVHDVLFTLFKNFKVINDTKDKDIFLTKNGKRFEIEFTPNDLITDPLCYYGKEDIKKIPFSPAYITSLDYSDIKIAKIIVDEILKIFPELYIDDDNDFIGPALKFLKCEK